MKYENNKVRDLNIAYIGGGSRGWAWTFMTDLSMDDSLSGTIRLYDIDEAAAKNNEIIGNKLTAREDTTGKWDYVTCSTIGEALTGCDFVVISILPGTFDEMASDVHLPERLGIYQYVKDHPIYYAGPAKTPEGYASGSLGPTTAGRMDSYVDLLQSHGASMVMLAKGNRSQQVTDACHKHGGFYLGSIGGPAAVLAQQSIKSLECVAYPELGMEAIWKIEVENFPAFILVDDKGNDFFQQIQNKQCAGCSQQRG